MYFDAKLIKKELFTPKITLHTHLILKRMSKNKKEQMQLRYLGFLDTPMLFKSLFNGLDPLVLSINTENYSFDHFDINESRLGKLIEHFVFKELNGIKNIDVLKTNIQINDSKTTIGELDALIKQANQLIHLEIIFKFYLYDNISTLSEINKWIGPNRKDSLSKKMDKLKTKQLPLLFNKLTNTYLSELGLNHNKIVQKIYFKAQLFVPFEMINHDFEFINNSCVQGYYLSINEVMTLPNTVKFHIPKKLDWLINPNNLVKWMSHKEFIPIISGCMDKKISPLCWIKTKEYLFKIFVVYWR